MVQLKKSTIRRGLHVFAGVLAFCTMSLLLIWAISRSQTHGVDFGRVSFSVSDSSVEVSLASAPMKRTASGWTFTGTGARIVVEKASDWRPSTQTASVSLTVPGLVVMPLFLRVIFVPVWLVLVVLILGVIVAVRLSHRITQPLHCTACDYDLRGNTLRRCPECGNTFLALTRAICA